MICLMKMVNLNDYITDADLELKLENILLDGQGRIDDECKACGGLVIIHKEGPCKRLEAKKMQEIADEKEYLKSQLLDKMEDFRQRRGQDVRTEKLLRGLIGSMGENNENLVKNLTQILTKEKKETVITKPKQPPTWGDETFERYEEQVKHWYANSQDSELNKYQLLYQRF